MHFQFPPAAETKLVRCTRGALLDVIIDLRPESETYLQHVAVELDACSMRALYVPERFANGYQTLQDDTVATYELGEVYTPSAEGGLPHDDPRLGLISPLPVIAISARDRNFRPLDEIGGELRRRMFADLPLVEAAQRVRDSHEGRREKGRSVRLAATQYRTFTCFELLRGAKCLFSLVIVIAG